LTNANASGAKKQCNRCGDEHTTYEHRQSCPAKDDTCSKCKKKGHHVIICHNGKRLNATGQVASATAPAGEDRAAFEEFKEFKRAQQQQQQRHQQQQQEQGDKCAKITAEFYRWNIDNPSINAIQEVGKCNNLNACNPTPTLYIHLKLVGKPIFRIKVLADMGATRSLISLSTATKHGCEIKETDVRLSVANGTKIDVAGTTSLQVDEKGHLVHTVVTIVSPNVQQTIVGWQDLRAMGVIPAEWPTMPPPPPTKDTICAVDEEERQLTRRSARVQQRKERETGSVNAVFTTLPPPLSKEEKKKTLLFRPPPPTTKEEKKKTQLLQPPPGLPRSVAINLPTCQIRQVQAAAALMGLPNRYNCHSRYNCQSQFLFCVKKDDSDHHKIMPVLTIPTIIGAAIATAMVTGRITGTAVYLTSGDADIVSRDQFKTEGGLHILELDHPEPWVIAMICITILIGMGTCGACYHKQEKKYVTDKEAMLRGRALGRAKELVHMGAPGADKLLQDVQTYHDMHHEINKMKMHQKTLPGSRGRYGEKPCENQQCSSCAKPYDKCC
jgi:hypothetical protein